jgi:predicted amidophosphoribosyltransferase
MLYQICPRCQFRLQATKHICSTCGQSLQGKKPEAHETTEHTDDTAKQGEEKSARSFWKSLFGTT